MKQIILFILIFFCSIRVSSADSTITTGEVLKYEIKKVRFKVGEAEFVFNGLMQKDNQDVLSLIFRSSAMRFSDEEKLFLDPVTYHPLFVERHINLFGKNENINEVYAKDIGSVKISKMTKKGSEEQVINKNGRLENIYGFIYRYRQTGSFNIGEKIAVNLPTKDVVMEVKRKENLKVDGKVYSAYYVESTDRQYRIWFSADEKKIPLKIEGAIGFGNTSMIYVPEK